MSKVNMTAYQTRVFVAILRHTLGFRKMEDRITGAQLARETELVKQNVHRALKELVARRMIIRNKKRIGINTDFSQWRDIPDGLKRGYGKK